MTRANPSRPWIIGGLLLCVVMAAVTWFFFAGPQLDDRSATEQQVSDAELQNSVLQQRIDKLRRDSQHVGDMRKKLEAERAGLPVDHQMDTFTEQLTRQAKAAGVVLTSITPGQPTLVALPAGAGGAGSGAGAGAGSGSAGSGGSGPIGAADSAAASADASATAADQAAQTTESAPPPAPKNAGPAGQLYSITVNVVGNGTMTAQRELLSLIEKAGPRRALVTSASFAPASGATAGAPAAAGPTDASTLWTMTATLQIFVAPQSPDQQAAISAELKGNG